MDKEVVALFSFNFPAQIPKLYSLATFIAGWEHDLKSFGYLVVYPHASILGESGLSVITHTPDIVYTLIQVNFFPYV